MLKKGVKSGCGDGNWGGLDGEGKGRVLKNGYWFSDV